jgi:hypothetical protein
MRGQVRGGKDRAFPYLSTVVKWTLLQFAHCSDSARTLPRARRLRVRLPRDVLVFPLPPALNCDITAHVCISRGLVLPNFGGAAITAATGSDEPKLRAPSARGRPGGLRGRFDIVRGQEAVVRSQSGSRDR